MSTDTEKRAIEALEGKAPLTEDLSRRCTEELTKRRCVECNACTLGRCARCRSLVCLDCWAAHKEKHHG